MEVHMGLLDEVLGKAMLGGNLSKPLMIALGTLFVSKMMGAGGAGQQSAPSIVPEAGAAPDGGHLGGIGGLVNKLEQAGHGETVKSWVEPGENKPIDPNQLGAALGPKAVSNAAQQAGMNEQELLSQLAAALPGIVDRLTPDGRIPSLQDVINIFTQGQQGQTPSQR
jgi:uncharacterized protein YidB (DUF937 family)